MPKSQTPYQRVITIVDIVKLMEPQNIEIQKQGVNMFFRWRSRRPWVTITLTSLIDTFSILVFYLLVATAQSSQENNQIPIDVPISENLPTLNKDYHVIFLKKDREIMFQNKKVMINELKNMIRTDQELFIAADRWLPYGEVDWLIQGLQKEGFEHISLLSQNQKN